MYVRRVPKTLEYRCVVEGSQVEGRECDIMLRRGAAFAAMPPTPPHAARTDWVCDGQAGQGLERDAVDEAMSVHFSPF